MTSRITSIASTLVCLGGLALAVVGALVPGRIADLVPGGILAAICSAPLTIASTIRRAQRATAEQLAAAQHDGYCLALDHVARGLLGQPPTGPTPGTPAEHQATVRTLRPVPTYQPPDRKAE